MLSGDLLYSFQVMDSAGVSSEFGCVAASYEDALRLVLLAGYPQALLLEQRQLTETESAREALKRVRAHPFLGKDWLPLVAAISLLTNALKPAGIFKLDTYGRVFDFDPYRSPFIQARREYDGSFYAELGGPFLASRGRTEVLAMLALLGWDVPDDPGVELAFEAERVPNSNRSFSAGWTGEAIAEFLLESLALVFEFTSKDLYSFGERNAENLSSVVGLKLIDPRGIYQVDLANETLEIGVDAEEVSLSLDVDNGSSMGSRSAEPSDLNLPVVTYSLAELDSEDQKPYEDVDEILFDLYEADLIDTEARMGPSAAEAARSRFDARLSTQGKKNASSFFVDGDVDGYYLNVDIWQDCGVWQSGKHARETYVGDNYLIGVAGAGWSVVLEQGAKDAEIADDIGELLQSALRASEVTWSQQIPGPEWIEPRFGNVDEILLTIRDAGIRCRVKAPELSIDIGLADQYILDVASDRQYVEAGLVGRVGDVGLTNAVSVQVLMYEAWGPANPGWFESYFPIEHNRVYLADDGWVVRIIDAGRDLLDDDELHQVANRLREVLGGEVLEPFE